MSPSRVSFSLDLNLNAERKTLGGDDSVVLSTTASFLICQLAEAFITYNLWNFNKGESRYNLLYHFIILCISHFSIILYIFVL